jgi:hypothetical protein
MRTAITNQSQIESGHGEGRCTNILAAFAQQTSIPTLSRLRSRVPLRWWEWGKLAGLASLVAWIALSIAGLNLHPAVVAVLLHVTLDFSLQTAETCARKREHGRHLLVHALAAGALPLAIAALVDGRPLAVITWSSASFLSHYAVDWTRKFGLRNQALGVALDQTCHALTIVALVLLDYPSKAM